jgi:hypothetical protein
MQCDVDIPDSSENLVRTVKARRLRARHQNEFVPKGAEVMPQFRESALHFELGNPFEGLGRVNRKPVPGWIEIDSSLNEGVQIGK